MLNIDIDYKTIAITSIVGAIAVYFASKAFKKTVEVVKETVETTAEGLNPVNKENWINKGFTSIYQGIFGSDQSLGADIYDLLHPKPMED